MLLSITTPAAGPAAGAEPPARAEAPPLPRRLPTLRGRLLLLVAIVAAPLLGLATAAAWQGHREERARAEARLLEQARGVAVAVDREIERAEAVLRTLGLSAALARGDLEGFEAEMRAAAAEFGLPALALVDGEGEFALATLWRPGERRAGIRAAGIGRRALLSGRTELSDLAANPVTGEPAITMVAPVFAGGGIPARMAPDGGAAARGEAARRPTHALGMALDRSRFRALLAKLRLPEGWNASVLDRSGAYVARLRNDAEMVGRRPPLEAAAALAGAPEGILARHRTPEGEPTIAAFARAPDSGFIVLVAVEERLFHGPLRAELLRTLAIGGAVTLGGLLLAWRLSRRILAAVRGVLRPDAAAAAVPHARRLREVEEVARLLRSARQGRDRAMAALRERAAQIESTYAAAPVGLALHDRELRWLAANQRMAAINGRPVEAHLGRTPHELLPEVAGQVELVLRRVLETGEPMENLAIRGATPGQPGVARDFLASYHPVRDAAGAVAGVSVAVQEVTELRRATAALEASEARFHGMVEAVPGLLFEADAAGRNLWVSRAWLAYTGYTEAEAAAATGGAGWAAIVHPDDVAAVRPLWHEALRAGTEYEARSRIRRHDGAWRWHLVRARPQRDAEGRILRWLGAATDIHDLVQTEERLRLVVGELNHRVKNVLATVQAIAAQTSRGATAAAGGEDAGRFVAEFNARLRSLGRAHELLTATFWEGARLDAVARAALAPWLAPAPAGPAAAGDGKAAEAPRIELRCREEGEMPALSPKQAQSVVLALHELATNAAKHGGLSRPGARVVVACGAEAAGGGLAVIEWTESGGPPVAGPPRRSGFGLRMLQRALAHDLGSGAEVALDFAVPEGLRARIRFRPG